MKETKLIVKNKFLKKYKSGYPLIMKDAIINMNALKEEGQLIRLLDEKKGFIGKGYYGIQNKGYGWILTQNEKEKIDHSFFHKKLLEAIKRRKKLYMDRNTTAFRVFNGEGDGIGGFTVDYFDGFYLINWYSKGIYTFKDYIINTLKNLSGCRGIYEKKRFDTGGKFIEEDGYVWGERAKFPLIVKENGVNFAIYLNEGAMVGVFLDQREVRKAIRDKYAKDKNVLNTFSYTGAFSVFAALGGARKTTSVDLANRSLPKTIEHFSLNNIDYEAQDIIVEDVFGYFKYAQKKNLKFDLIILDPPSFAKSKKNRFSAAKDYKDLLKSVINITEDGGVIVASTNCASFDMKKFKDFIDKAFNEMDKKYKILEEYRLPEDFRTIREFREGNYLKVVFIKKY
ncbi:class I SAM-dependent rRNA methyltransferase [Crassaminicella thermophila]|uniref:Class I SAM-dependent rRNA methyltransferase n=1 Tax=Crassaminicella thermophila TaxID=2599308 RepID=A0A5C0SD99_CRATE|nr:class I SAM-dependent rRNA methyltransferase [Crassaminicella thermophila]QEK11368.1 class I SAM-dependent rRNA methyltransferase [Crassaminicella thermophila]